MLHIGAVVDWNELNSNFTLEFSFRLWHQAIYVCFEMCKNGTSNRHRSLFIA